MVGFITANMVLLAGKAVSFANALSTGLLGQGVDARSAAGTLTSLMLNAVTNGGIFLSLIGIGLAYVLLALLVCYVIRVALTVILIAGAPLALMCHALPQTEGIARWWWPRVQNHHDPGSRPSCLTTVTRSCSRPIRAQSRHRSQYATTAEGAIRLSHGALSKATAEIGTRYAPGRATPVGSHSLPGLSCPSRTPT